MAGLPTQKVAKRESELFNTSKAPIEGGQPSTVEKLPWRPSRYRSRQSGDRKKYRTICRAVCRIARRGYISSTDQEH